MTKLMSDEQWITDPNIVVPLYCIELEIRKYMFSDHRNERKLFVRYTLLTIQFDELCNLLNRSSHGHNYRWWVLGKSTQVSQNAEVEVIASDWGNHEYYLLDCTFRLVEDIWYLCLDSIVQLDVTLNEKSFLVGYAQSFKSLKPSRADF